MKLEKELRSQILIHLLSFKGERLKHFYSVLKDLGYSVQILENPDLNSPPHIVFIDLEPSIQFTEWVLNYNRASDETVIWLLGPLSLSSEIENLRGFGVYGLIEMVSGWEWHGAQIAELTASEFVLKLQTEELSRSLESGSLSHQAQLLELKQKIRDLHQESIKIEESWKDQQKKTLEQIQFLEKENASLKNELYQLKWVTETLSYPKQYDRKQNPWNFFFEKLGGVVLDHNQFRFIYFKFLPEIHGFQPMLQWAWPETCLLKKDLKVLKINLEDLNSISEIELSKRIQDFYKEDFNPLNFAFAVLFDFATGLDGILYYEIEGPQQNIASQKLSKWIESFYFYLQGWRLFLNWEKIQSQLDPITGLENQKKFFDRLDEEIRRCSRIKMSLSLIYLSIDNFKELEDAHGKSFMKTVLQQIASILKINGRVHDGFYSIGWNEFVVILPHTEAKEAAIMAERIRSLIATRSFDPFAPGYITVSAGVSGYPDVIPDPKNLFESTKTALEFIKSKSSNKVCIFTPPKK